MFRVPFLEECRGCGGFAEIETESEYLVLDAKRANIGDIVRCSLCECAGVIGGADGSQYCTWDDGLCEKCEEAFEALLNKLAERIIRQIREGV